MYQLKNNDENLKLNISDHEFDLLPPHKRVLYEAYVRKTPRPISNFKLRDEKINLNLSEI